MCAPRFPSWKKRERERQIWRPPELAARKRRKTGTWLEHDFSSYANPSPRFGRVLSFKRAQLLHLFPLIFPRPPPRRGSPLVTLESFRSRSTFPPPPPPHPSRFISSRFFRYPPPFYLDECDVISQAMDYNRVGWDPMNWSMKSRVRPRLSSASLSYPGVREIVMALINASTERLRSA